jgi:2-aminoethylphosphonate-pyruvate transaminase
MLASFAPHDATTLVIANGVYGERIAKMLAAHRRPHTVVKAAWGDAIDLDAVRSALQQQTGVRYVAVVHHETTTGRLNNLLPLSTLCSEFGASLLLDCVSSFGAEAINADQLNITALAATANKCLHGVPGISFVLARKETWRNALVPAGSVYLDLAAYHATQHDQGYSPFTQSVQPAFALREALEELEDEGGWEQRRSIYRRRAGYVAVTLKALGLQTMLPPEEYSCVLWSWLLPEGFSYADVHKSLKRDGFIVYQGQGHFSREMFRIAHMGDIHNADLDRLEAALRKCFKRP